MLKLFRQLKPYTLLIVFVLLLIFLQSLSDLYLPTLMADIVDKGIVNGDISYILKIGGFMLFITALGVVCSITASFYSAKVAAGFSKDLRSKVFSHVEHFSLQEFDQVGTASLITRTTNDITQIQQVLTVILRMMIMAPLMCIGGMIMAVSKDAELSLIFVVVLPFLVLLIAMIAKKGMPLFKAMQVKLDRLNLVLRENLTGIRVIRAFNRTSQEQERFNEASTDLMHTAIKVNKLMALLMPMMMLVLNVSTIAIVWFGGLRIDHGDMQVGDLMAFIQYGMQIMFSFIMVSIMFVVIPRASVSAARINEVLEMKPTIKEVANGKDTKQQKGLLEFKHVTFRYPGAEQPALTDITFSAKRGEVTAIIGGTGSGKSTLIRLIPRFYDVEQGSILLDGVDLREMTQKHLRSKIGYVPQKAVLFTGTVTDNLRYGKEDATDEEIKHACDIAQATSFISSMNDGFHSVISQGATNISGGQKQRLSIARALVRKPEIYLFDDSFSALDYKTDAKLRAALKQETSESIVFMVAQRVSTVMDADQIIVLDEGKVAGVGTHKELMKTCQVYREIVSSQLSEEELA